MSDIPITTGNGTASVATDLVSGQNYQQIKIYDGTLGSATPLQINADGSLTASVYGTVSVVGTIGASIIGSVPVTFAAAANQSVSGTVTTQYAPAASFVSGVTSQFTGLTSVLVLPTPAGGQRNYITQLLVTNAAANGTFVSIVDAGSTIYSGYAGASGGGFSASFPTPLRQSSLMGSLGAISSVQASVIVSASGYTSA